MGKKNTSKWIRRGLGNINFKGKKEIVLGCRCCGGYNLTEYHKEKQTQKYIAEEIINNDFRD